MLVFPLYKQFPSSPKTDELNLLEVEFENKKMNKILVSTGKFLNRELER